MRVRERNNENTVARAGSDVSLSPGVIRVALAQLAREAVCFLSFASLPILPALLYLRRAE